MGCGDGGRAFTIIFDGNGGEGRGPNVIREAANTPVELPGPSGLTMEGYTFIGWSRVANEGQLLNSGDTIVMPAENIRMYARWAAASIRIALSGIPQEYVGLEAAVALETDLAETVAYSDWVLVEGSTVILHPRVSSDSPDAGQPFSDTGNFILYVSFREAGARGDLVQAYDTIPVPVGIGVTSVQHSSLLPALSLTVTGISREYHDFDIQAMLLEAATGRELSRSNIGFVELGGGGVTFLHFTNIRPDDFGVALFLWPYGEDDYWVRYETTEAQSISGGENILQFSRFELTHSYEDL